MPTTKIGGLDFFYEETGAGDPVLFLHGLGSSSIDWEFQIPAFATSHRVIAMDVRGHGRSAKPAGPYSVKQMAAVALALLDQLGAKPAHVVGLSMGGMIAFQMAVDSPEAIRTMTIINSGPEMIMRTPEQKAGIEARYTIVRTQGMGALAKMVAGPLFPVQNDLRERFEKQVASNDPEAYLAALGAINGWSVSDRIASIRCRTLILASDQDYTPVEWKHFYAAQMPDARVVELKDSRHAAPLDAPEQVNRAIQEFLAQ